MKPVKQIMLWTVYLSMVMFPFSAFGALSLQDGITAIQITSGMNPDAQGYVPADINGDNAIGTAEAIYILQCLSGLRPACETEPPSVPANVQATAISSNQIDLTWTASTDNVGVMGYGVYRAATNAGTTTPSYSDIGLMASTNYCYSVFAYDRAGNRSGLSAQSCATTQNVTTGQVTLDSAGTVQSTVTVAGPGGSQLTLYAGTRIALIGQSGEIEPPVSLDNVYLSLIAPSESLPALPDGITALTQLRIVLTIDGTGRDALFWPTSTSGSAQQGMKLLVVITGPNVNDGTLGMLYDVASGSAVRVGSSALKLLGGTAAGTALRAPLEADGSGSRQMQFSPGGTGSYIAGGSASGTGSAPAGAFQSSFIVPDPGCIAVGTATVCGPSRVDRIEIVEESTEDILGMCWFGESTTATTGSIPPGYQFWCERNQGASGGSTEIKISSMQANLPLIHAYLVRASDGLPMWDLYVQPAGGLTAPGGAVYSDPYQKKEFEFAGYKKLIFKTTADKKYDWMRQHALIPLQNAGYTANLHSFTATSPGFIADIGVYDTLDARVLMEENVILKEPWKVRKGEETRGNRGTYDYTPKYQGTAKATMLFPIINTKVWDINADVTFEKDPALSTDTMDVYTAGGTLTQISYTVPEGQGFCWGIPDSFTDTYPIAKGEFGDLWIKKDGNPVEYVASATISSETTSLPTHSYSRCCNYGQGVECTDETLEPDEQEHMWLMTELGGTFRTGQPDGRLQGTFQHVGPTGINAGLYEWDLAPADENQ